MLKMFVRNKVKMIQPYKIKSQNQKLKMDHLGSLNDEPYDNFSYRTCTKLLLLWQLNHLQP